MRLLKRQCDNFDESKNKKGNTNGEYAVRYATAVAHNVKSI